LAKFDLKAYARTGAAARVGELNDELAAIYRAFPDLRQPRRGRPQSPSPTADGPGRGSEIGNGRASASAAPRRRRRWKMSAAQKKAVGLRMKKYWAERRKNAR
jgi:hypothetical protein